MAVLAQAGKAKLERSTYEVPIFFVGDRRPKNLIVGDWSPDQMIASQNISYGVVNVPTDIPSESSIPDHLDWTASNKRGREARNFILSQIQSSTSISVNFGASGGKYTPFDSTDFKSRFLGRFKTYLENSRQKRFILFVHGCCIDASTSMQRAAELAANTKLPVLMFDWATPSLMQAPILPEVNTYRRSERVLEISQHNYSEMVDALVSVLEDYDCILLGHSMGCRIICTDILRRGSPREFLISQLHLVRPDQSLPAFILDEHKICEHTNRTYIYCAENDPELKKAQTISADVPRLGRLGKKFFGTSMRLGMTLDSPSNRYFIDVSAAKLNHSIPFRLIEHVINKGVEDGSNYVFKPWSDQHTKRNLLFLETH